MNIRHQEIEEVLLDDIRIGDRHRSVNNDAVKSLSESMREIGLMTPITVRPVDNDEWFEIVTGHHRYLAARELGWDRIDAIVRDCDEIEARLWEISENLHRSDLAAVERSEHIAEWIELCRQRKGAQVGHPGGPQPTEQGQSEASRDLNIPRASIQRAQKIASLSDEAKEAAKEYGLDDNQSALLDAAKHDDSASQVAALRKRKKRKKREGPTTEQQVKSLMTAWHRASDEAKKQFLERIGM